MLAKHAIPKKIKSNILSIAALAQETKRQYPSTIDGTIGMLFDEDGKLMSFKAVKEAMSQLEDKDIYGYSTISGGKEFRTSILKWCFQEYYDEIMNEMKVEVIATPGGSGALGIAIANYLNPNEYFITSDLGWGNYQVIGNESFNPIKYYPLLDEKLSFNMACFKEAVQTSVNEQGKAFVIINDPCHNPTGFALSFEEWKTIVSFLNGFDCPIVLLLDMAYIDYFPGGMKESREVFRLFEQNKENVLTLLALSGSKTYSIYGLRLGALIGLSKNEAIIQAFFDASEYSARARWSSSNHGAISMVNYLASHENLLNTFKKEQADASIMLMKRAIAFNEEAKEIGLFCYPYKGGFFITIPCKGKEVYEALMNERIFVVPLATGVRISLSALSLKDIKGLAQKIKEKIK